MATLQRSGWVKSNFFRWLCTLRKTRTHIDYMLLRCLQTGESLKRSKLQQHVVVVYWTTLLWKHLIRLTWHVTRWRQEERWKPKQQHCKETHFCGSQHSFFFFSNVFSALRGPYLSNAQTEKVVKLAKKVAYSPVFTFLVNFTFF